MLKRRKELDPTLTVLGAGSSLTGKISASGALQVDGAVSGQLSCEAGLSVGSQGRVLGQVRAQHLTIAGRVDGIVYAREHMNVRATGQVRGHARYSTLEVERGGVMNASTSLTADFPESDDDEEAAE